MTEIILPDPPAQPRELTIQRRLTTAFIATMPVELVLTSRARVRKPGGGFVWEEGAPRQAQTLRLIEPGSWPREITTADGVSRTVEYELLGEWDAVIGLNDVFSYDGADWEVAELMGFNGWERRAWVVRHGLVGG